VLLPTADQALVLLPLEIFMDFVKKAAKKAIANPAIQRALAYLGDNSSRCRCDKQGRMALKRSMLDSIGVGKTVKLIGAVNHIRICAPENWHPSGDPSEYLREIQQISDGNDEIDALGGMLQGVLGK
jgi:DNA-binding transcriptional regulator/RsmH inhibitor MraZ